MRDGGTGVWGSWAIAALVLAGCPAAITADRIAPAKQLDVPFSDLQPEADRDEADRLLQAGFEQRERGNLEKAIDSWLDTIDIYDELADLDALMVVYNALGRAYADLELYPQAEFALRRSLGLAREVDDRSVQLEVLNRLGRLLLGRSALGEATAFFDEALELARSLDNLEGEALTLGNLGLLAFTTGDYAEAIVRYESALAIYEALPDPVPETTLLNRLGAAYWGLGDYENTIGAFGAALRRARQSIDLPNRFRALDGLIAAHSAVGRYARALELLDERLEVAREVENDLEEILTLRQLGQLYSNAGNLEQTRYFYLGAIGLASELGAEREELQLREELSEILYNFLVDSP